MSGRPKPFSKNYQKQWSQTHSYKHQTTGEYCTAEAFIAEYLILRWTEEFKMEKPSYKFWTKGDKYHRPFMKNMKAAQALLKKYEPATILAAIKKYDKEFKWWMKAAEESAKADEAQVESEQKQVKTRKKQYSNKKSSINKLRDL